MNFKYLAYLTFIVSQAIYITSAGQTDDERNEKKGCHPNNGRSKILSYRDGKVNRPISVGEISNKQQWALRYALLFGNGKFWPESLNVDIKAKRFQLSILSSKKDHLEIYTEPSLSSHHKQTENAVIGGDDPMNGFLFPSKYHTGLIIERILVEQISEQRPFLVQSWTGEGELKLAIIFSNGDDQEGVRGRALMAADRIRRNYGNVPICIVAQPDRRYQIKATARSDSFGRDVAQPINIGKFVAHVSSYGANMYYDSSSTVFKFYGSNMNVFTLVVDEHDTTEALKIKLEEWKESLSFDDNCETIAFHFTAADETKTKISEDLFSKTFQKIPLSTLRLHDKSSTIGVSEQVDFNEGSVFVIATLQNHASTGSAMEKPMTEE